MNIIVLQHIKIEDPGHIKDLMLADGFKLTTIELDEGEKIPSDLSKFEGMFCMGGPMDTFMEQEYPWLIEEKKAIKEFVVNLKKPYLGFCLGCQLLGEVIGGKVVKSNPAEIGIMDINFTKEKNEDILFSKFPEQIKSLQWHSYEVQGIENNKDVTLLASSPVTKYQIFKYQNHAYAIQFHIEIKETTVNEWGCVPEYKKALEDQLGDGALEKFDKAAKNNMTDMNNYSKILYKNFKNKLKLGPQVKFKKAKLPLKKKLVGNYTILEPLNVSKHSKGLYSEYSKDKKNIIWTYLPYGPFKTYLNFRNWMKSFCLNKDPFFYSIYSKRQKKYCGMASYLRIEPDHGSIEVGHINYSPLLQNSVEGTETMYLMMKNAFEVLGNRRYEWKCNNLNSSSKKAALRLGFRFEGVFRQMFIFKGRSRDSAWFSILDKEWPKNKKRFLNYLKKINFDKNFKQIKKL